MSTFSPSLRIELIASGSQSGTWGVTTNNNLGDLIEQAISGVTDLNVTAADITLTALNGVTDQSRSAVLSITGTAGTTRTITIPNVQKSYTVKNRSDSTVSIKTLAGSAFSVPTLAEAYIYCDGNDVVTGRAITDAANTFTSNTNPLNNTALTGIPIAPTAVPGTSNTQIATTAYVNSEIAADTANLAPLNSPALTGVPTAPTATSGTNTTQLATTAFVNSEIAADTANLAPLNSPALTGTPTAPTAVVSTNTTQLATTAFVNAEIANDAPTKTGGGASGTWGISISGNAATATNPQSGGSFITSSNIGSQSVSFATTSASCSGNAATATNPQSGGSFITSSNIGSQSVSFATNATTASNSSSLGGVAASSYARRDVANTYTGASTFNGLITSGAYNFTSITSIFNTGDSDIQMVVNNGVQLKIDSAGNLTISGNTAVKQTGTTWVNPSDARLKENVKPYTKGLAELDRINPKTWVFNGKGGTVKGTEALGVIADEIEGVLPNTVSTHPTKLNLTDEFETEIKRFDASELTWLLVNSVKELKAEVEALKAQLQGG